MVVQSVRQESFNEKKEVDEAQSVPELPGTTALKFDADEKREDLDIGAQVCQISCYTISRISPTDV